MSVERKIFEPKLAGNVRSCKLRLLATLREVFVRVISQVKFEALGSSRAELARIVLRVPRSVRKNEYRALGRVIPAESCGK